MKKKVVPKLWQEVKVKVDIVTSDDNKIYYTGKFQDFIPRYIINRCSYRLVESCNKGYEYDDHDLQAVISVSKGFAFNTTVYYS